MLYNVDEKGYYGDFGGAYIPEMLYPNVEELRNNYKTLTAAPEFQKEFHQFLHLLQQFLMELQLIHLSRLCRVLKQNLQIHRV